MASRGRFPALVDTELGLFLMVQRGPSRSGARLATPQPRDRKRPASRTKPSPGGPQMTDPAVRPKPACARCGAPMGRGRRRAGTCRACVLGAAAARRERIAALRAHGATSREISKALNTSPGAIRVELHRTRHAPNARKSVTVRFVELPGGPNHRSTRSSPSSFARAHRPGVGGRR